MCRAGKEPGKDEDCIREHTPDAPRLRLVIPLKREVTEDEYPAVGRKVAQEIGMDLFDDSTYEPNRLMYWPSTSSNGEYVYEVIDGEVLDSDEYLARYDDWRDISTWPVSSRESEVVKSSVKKQADPQAKEGIVGVFCRAYGIRDAIEKFLPDVYEASAMEGRYDYIPADSSAGVQIIEEKFAYSHHASDPACGKLLNAFDVVRVHKFPDDDEKKSFNAMTDLAGSDERVKLAILAEKQQTAAAEFDEEDRIVLLPGAKIGFVEVKAPGKKPRPLQASRHRLLGKLGFNVYVLDRLDQ